MKQSRSSDTRKRIVNAARELFQSKGFDGTSVAEICRTAGVSNGALFHQFPTKEALGFAVYSLIRAEFFPRNLDIRLLSHICPECRRTRRMLGLETRGPPQCCGNSGTYRVAHWRLVDDHCAPKPPVVGRSGPTCLRIFLGSRGCRTRLRKIRNPTNPCIHLSHSGYEF